MMVGERLVMAGMEVVTRVVSDDSKGGRKVGGDGGPPIITGVGFSPSTAAGFLAFCDSGLD